MQERPHLPTEQDVRPVAMATARAAASRAEAGPPPAPSTPEGLDDPRALQILATEHSSLVAVRSMLWNESFARAALFLSVLSACVVALSLIGTERADFVAFALVLLPVALFVGAATFVRIDDSNREEIRWVVATNRIRHAYITMVPEVADRFISGVTDDSAGILASYGLAPGVRYSLVHFFVTMPGMVAVVNGVVAGVIAATAMSAAGSTSPVIAGATFVAGVATVFLQGLRSKRAFDRLSAGHQPQFPSVAAGSARRP
jgi:hypothetical protein